MSVQVESGRQYSSPLERTKALACLLGVLVGCDIYRPPNEFDAARDAGTDANVIPDAGDECAQARLPARPEVEDGPDQGGTRFFIMHNFELSQPRNVWADIGFDLDSRRTEGEATACCVGDDGTHHVDRICGVDNRAAEDAISVLTILNSWVSIVDDTACEETQCGEEGSGYESCTVECLTEWNIRNRGLATVFGLRGYNGQRNDPAVEVIIATAIGFADEGTEELRLDGTDRLVLADDNFNGGDLSDPIELIRSAYVADGVVVAESNIQREVTFRAGRFDMNVRLSGTAIVAELSDDLTNIEDVRLGGRWRRSDLLQGAEAVGVCPGTTDYQSISNFLRIADTMSDPNICDPRVMCDSISIAVRFDMAQFQAVRTEEERPPIANPCATDEGT